MITTENIILFLTAWLCAGIVRCYMQNDWIATLGFICSQINTRRYAVHTVILIFWLIALGPFGYYTSRETMNDENDLGFMLFVFLVLSITIGAISMVALNKTL